MYRKAETLNITNDIINVVDEYDNSALYWAITNGNSRSAQYIIDRGANVNTATNRFGFAFEGDTPLIVASGSRDLSIVNALIKNGAKVNVTRNDGAHAAFMAAQKGHLEILQLLVDKDPSVAYLKGFRGRSALYAAALAGHLNIIKYLTSLQDTDMNSEDDNGQVPIVAAIKENLDILKYLISFPQTNLDVKDINGYTPLIHAVRENRTEVVQFLLQKGADASIKDNFGRNALYWALSRNDMNVIKMLEQYS